KGNQAVNVNNLFEKYYSPGLIKRVQEKDPSLNNRGELLEGDMNPLPKVSLALGASGTRDIIANSASVCHSASSILPIEISIEANNSPLDEILLYNNGKLIAQESLEESISFRGGQANKRTLTVELSNGINEISVVIVNKER